MARYDYSHRRSPGNVLLRNAQFEKADIEQHFIGAGVVPVATDPRTGARIVLLAREAKHNNYRGSLKWSAFEGGRKGLETITQTSMREWTEESLGCVAFRDDECMCEIVLNVVQPHNEGAHKYHVNFVREVDYLDYPARFQAERRRLLDVQHSGAVLNGDTGDMEPEDLDALRARYHEALSAVTCREALRHGGAYFEVHPEYLEKDRLGWFSEGELRVMFRRGGRLDDCVVRPYFLPVLEALLVCIAEERGAAEP